MANHKITQLIILLTLGTFLIALACPTCPPPTPSHKPPPKVKPPPKPPVVKPPPKPKTPVTPSPETPCPPPPAPTPPKTPTAPKSPPKTPSAPKSPPKQESCPIDTLKLGACVDVLGGLVHIGIGSSSKEECCPVLSGLADLDAGICLCTAIKANVLNLNIIVPIILEVLVDCGKTPPKGFQCPT